MNNVYLSKSKYCRANQCPKMLWMDKYMPEAFEQTASDEILTNGAKVGELARGLFGKYVNIEYNKNLEVMVEQTKEYLKNAPNIITEASFNYDNNFCSVDILKNDIDGLEIFEVKSSTTISEVYLQDISYQVYVLLNLGYKVKSANIVYINNQYVRQGELELNKLFNIKNVTKIAYSKQGEIKEKIEQIREYMQNGKEPEKDIGMYCFEPYKCEYWKYCTKHLPEKNIFWLAGMHKDKKIDLYKKGIYKLEDVVKEDINEKYKQQIEFELYNKEPVIKKEEIREAIKDITYPLYFLDFETFQQVIPEYDGIRPYMKIPFQYSLHYIEKEDGELKHKEFLGEAGVDPRRKLAERLVEDIPTDACVLAYNMSFEKSRLTELAQVFPDLAEKLLAIRDNIKDLMIPFFYRMYYTKNMEGSYSIKAVLPSLFPDEPELNYHNLELVHNGGEASEIFASLAEKPKEEQEKIRKALLEYCKLDTLAMVKIWEKLKEIKERK